MRDDGEGHRHPNVFLPLQCPLSVVRINAVGGPGCSRRPEHLQTRNLSLPRLPPLLMVPRRVEVIRPGNYRYRVLSMLT